MIPQALASYLSEGLRSHIPHGELRQQALSVGWTEEEFNAAYAAAALSAGVPMPERGSKAAIRKSSTVEIILNFFSFILLGTVATALGVLLFQVVNRYFPDALSMRYSYDLGYSTSAIHYSIAALIVAFPLYYAAMRLWFRRFREEEAKSESRLTRWLTYLVLLVTAVTIVGDLITTVYYLLQGEITVRFLLKALVILAITGAIFGFYFLERRAVQYGHDIARRVFQTFGYVVAAFVLGSIILGFLAGGSPSTQRSRTFDAQRSSDLSSLATCIGNYAREYDRLPASFDELAKSGQYSYCSQTSDPETGASYEYRIVTPSRMVGTVKEAEFELCATYAFSSEDGAKSQVAYQYEGGKWYKHDAGRSCNTETVVFEKVPSTIK